MTDAIVDWTARIAVGCCLVRWWLAVRRGVSQSTSRAERLWWSVGFAIFLAHVAAAFQFVHDWSHTAAYADTARQTDEVIGWNWGGGIYINYLFTVIWGVDVARLWAAQGGKPFRWLPHWWPQFVTGLFWFLILNATIVFGPRWWIAVFAPYVALIVWRNRNS